jgi:hypothetical protein
MLNNGEKNKLLSGLVRAFAGTAVLGALALCLAFTTPRAWAAGVSSNKVGTAQLESSSTVGSARSVVLGDLPKATIAELAAHPEPDRPLDGLTDEQYEAKKKAALTRWPIIHTGKEGPPPMKGTPTPGFHFAVVEMDEAQGCRAANHLTWLWRSAKTLLCRW